MAKFFYGRKRYGTSITNDAVEQRRSILEVAETSIPSNTRETAARRQNLSSNSDINWDTDDESVLQEEDDQADDNSNSYRQKMERLNKAWDIAVLEKGAQYLQYTSVSKKICSLDSCHLNAAAICKTCPNGCEFCEDHASDHFSRNAHVLVRADSTFIGSQLPDQYAGATRNTAPVMITSQGWFYGDHLVGSIKDVECWWSSRSSTLVHFSLMSRLASNFTTAMISVEKPPPSKWKGGLGMALRRFMAMTNGLDHGMSLTQITSQQIDKRIKCPICFGEKAKGPVMMVI